MSSKDSPRFWEEFIKWLGMYLLIGFVMWVVLAMLMFQGSPGDALNFVVRFLTETIYGSLFLGLVLIGSLIQAYQESGASGNESVSEVDSGEMKSESRSEGLRRRNWWAPISYAVLLSLLLIPSYLGIGPRVLQNYAMIFWLIIFGGPPLFSFANTIYNGSLISSLVIGILPGIYNLGASVLIWFTTNPRGLDSSRPPLSEYIYVELIMLFLALGLGGALIGILAGKGYNRYLK